MIRVFRHYVPTSIVLLGTIEAAIFFFSIALGKVLRFTVYEYDPTLGDVLTESAVYCAVMTLSMIGLGLYDLDNMLTSFRTTTGLITVSFATGLLVMVMIYYLVPALRLGRGEFALAVAIAYTGVIGARLLYRRLYNKRAFRKRVIVLGTGLKAKQIEELVLAGHLPHLAITAFVPVSPEPLLVSRSRVDDCADSLYELAAIKYASDVIVAIDDRRDRLPFLELIECKRRGLSVIDASDFLERQLGKVRLADLRPGKIIYSDGFRFPGFTIAIKRAYDILISTSLLAVSWPVLLITALAIWLESGCKGPILYRQERVGLGNRPFSLVKFRSMRTDAEADGVPIWASAKDPRITRVGEFIRRTRIDELPQLYNILVGQMSFVGPRPERTQFVQQLSAVIPYYALRHHAKPGLTGWAQIRYPYGASVEDAKQKLEYDLYYIKNYSLFLDIMVAIQTLHVVMTAKGAR